MTVIRGQPPWLRRGQKLKVNEPGNAWFHAVQNVLLKTSVRFANPVEVEAWENDPEEYPLPRWERYSPHGTNWEILLPPIEGGGGGGWDGYFFPKTSPNSAINFNSPGPLYGWDMEAAGDPKPWIGAVQGELLIQDLRGGDPEYRWADRGGSINEEYEQSYWVAIKVEETAQLAKGYRPKTGWSVYGRIT